MEILCDMLALVKISDHQQRNPSPCDPPFYTVITTGHFEKWNWAETIILRLPDTWLIMWKYAQSQYSLSLRLHFTFTFISTDTILFEVRNQ